MVPNGCLQEAHAKEVEALQRDRTLGPRRRQRGDMAPQLRTVEERLGTEKTAWQENFTRRQETTFLAREREMRESLRQERDKVGYSRDPAPLYLLSSLTPSLPLCLSPLPVYL